MQLNGYYYPAGVYVGTLFSGSQPYASVVRAIDSNVVNLITLAGVQGDSGTNFTGDGVITIIPSQALSAKSPGYVQFRLMPPAAVRAGAGWRLLGDTTYTNVINYTRTLTSTNAFAIEFKPINGWKPPVDQTIALMPGELVRYDAFYTVSNPVMVANRTVGIGIIGTTGTTYQLERSSSLAGGAWMSVQTNTLGLGVNVLLPWPFSNVPPAFYRARWLTN